MNRRRGASFDTRHASSWRRCRWFAARPLRTCAKDLSPAADGASRCTLRPFVPTSLCPFLDPLIPVEQGPLPDGRGSDARLTAPNSAHTTSGPCSTHYRIDWGAFLRAARARVDRRGERRRGHGGDPHRAARGRRPPGRRAPVLPSSSTVRFLETLPVPAAPSSISSPRRG